MTDTPDNQASQSTEASPEAQHPHGAQPTPPEPVPVTASDSTSAEPADLAPPIAALIAAIRAAVAASASPEARVAGAAACRSLLTVLDAKPGQPLTPPPQSATSAASPLASLFSQPGFLTTLAKMSREQLLDLLKQAGAALPDRSAAPRGGPRFHLIQIPQVRRPDGT